MDLINACKTNDIEKALGIIKNNKKNLGVIDYYGRTALIWAIMCNTYVAFKLIKTGYSNP